MDRFNELLIVAILNELVLKHLFLMVNLYGIKMMKSKFGDNI